MAKENNKL